MALSGSFSGSVVSGHYAVRVDWTAAQDIANNRTTITCNLYFVNDWSINIGARTNTVTIAGTSYSIGSSAISTTGTHHIGSCSKTIDHNPDGSLGNITLSAAFNMNATIKDYGTYKSITASDTVWIDTIPRASQPSLSLTNFTVGDPVVLYTNRKSTAFTHEVFLRRNDGLYYGALVSGIADRINIADYPGIIDLLYSQKTDGRVWNSCFLLRTWNGGSLVGDKEVWFNSTIPENESTKPTVTMDISPTDLEDWVETDYVQGKSQVKAEMTASPKWYAGIKSYNVTVDGKTTTLSTSSGSAAVTTQVLNNSGTFTVVGKSIDTRDFPSNEEKRDITVVPYGKPFLTHNSAYGSIVCARYDEDEGVLADNGTSIKLIIGAKWYSLSNKENTATVEFRCVSGATDSGWKPIEITEQGGGAENKYISYCDINTVLPDISVAVDKTYSIYIRCTDRFGAYNSDSEIPYKIPTEDVCLHLGKGGNKAAFGKYAEEDKTLEVAPDWDLKLKGDVLKDFIVEQDTSGIWTYEKRANGIAECWGLFTVNNCDISTPWGSLYESKSPISVDFPENLFVDAPVCNMSVQQSSAGILSLEISNSQTTKGKTCNIYPTRATSAVVTLTIAIRAIGRWK